MDRKGAILEAALESFAETGETAIEDVRSRSGASVGAIYHHFGGQDGIAAALYVETLRSYQAGVMRTLGRAGSAEDGVEGLARHHLRWVERNPDRARFLLRGAAARAAAGEELEELNRDLAAALEDWVGEQGPDIRPLPREVFYAVVIGPAQEVSRLWLAGRAGSLRKLEDDLAAAAWRAVRAD
jgi:AcrR family transcriptional regulator